MRIWVAGLLVLLTACSSADKQKVACEQGDPAACDALATIYGIRARELCEKSDGGASAACANYPKSVALDLPKATNGDPAEAITMSLTADGKVYGNGELLPNDDAIHAFAKAASRKSPDIRAVIVADPATAQGNVIRVIDLLKQDGITKMAFGVGPTAPKEKP